MEDIRPTVKFPQQFLPFAASKFEFSSVVHEDSRPAFTRNFIFLTIDDWFQPSKTKIHLNLWKMLFGSTFSRIPKS
jgi:hypothetical protein